MGCHKLIISLILIAIITIIIKQIKEPVEGFSNKNNGLNKFDGIVYINLSSRKDRKKHILDQLDQYGVKSENRIYRIDAVHTPKNGHKGCALSHVKALKLAKDKGWNNVLILEDDFEFALSPEETNRMVSQFFFNFSKKEWDVVLLAANGGLLQKTPHFYLWRVLGRAQTTSGYAIHSRFYDTLLTCFQESADKMDENKTSGVNWEGYAIDQQWKKYQKNAKWYMFNPKLGKQSDKLYSSIQAETNYNITSNIKKNET